MQVTLQEGDVLPPNVEVLEVVGCQDIAPISALQSLRELVVQHTTVTDTGLQALSTLQALTCMYLGHSFSRAFKWDLAGLCAAAWSKVPLMSLMVAGVNFHSDSTVATLHHLGMATRLAELFLEADCLLDWDSDANASLFASALQQLTALQRLHLSTLPPRPRRHAASGNSDSESGMDSNSESESESMPVDGVSPPPSPQQGSGWVNVVQSVTTLPKLRDLLLGALPLQSLGHPMFATPLGVAPQVTHLQLRGSYDDAVLLPLVGCFTGLRAFDLGDRLSGPVVSDAVLAAVAQQMSHLEDLNLWGCSGFTPAGIMQLSCLQRLRLVSVADSDYYPGYDPDCCEAARSVVGARCQQEY